MLVEPDGVFLRADRRAERWPASRTESRTLRFRRTQPSSFAPNTRSNRRCGISSGGNARSGPAQLMFFCIAPPKDSCDTPICSERNRLSDGNRRATI